MDTQANINPRPPGPHGFARSTFGSNSRAAVFYSVNRGSPYFPRIASGSEGGNGNTSLSNSRQNLVSCTSNKQFPTLLGRPSDSNSQEPALFGSSSSSTWQQSTMFDLSNSQPSGFSFGSATNSEPAVVGRDSASLNPPNSLFGYETTMDPNFQEAQSVGFSSTSSPSSGGSSEVEECPICFEMLLPPIYQCPSGHLCCEDCESKLETCPQCRVPLPKSSKIRNLFAESFIRDKSFKCNSCLLSFKGEDVKAHRDDCLLRTHNYCVLLNLNCGHECTSENLIQHLVSVHWLTGCSFNSELVGGSRFVVKLEQTAWLDYLVGQGGGTVLRFSPHFVRFQSHIFVVSTNFCMAVEGSGRLYWNVYLVGSEKVSKDFTVKIKLTHNDASQISWKWKGPVHSIKSYQQENGGFNVTADTLAKLVNPANKDVERSAGNSELKWIVEITFSRHCVPAPAAQPFGINMVTNPCPGLQTVFRSSTLITSFMSTDSFMHNDTDVALEPSVWDETNLQV